jgi:hypothetical protein
MKTRNYDSAMKAWTRAAQMDPENGETWNNLAAVHMRLERWPEAFAALTEAVKHKRDSWHTWDNYSVAAAHVKEWQAAARGIGKTLALSQGQRLNFDVLESVVKEVERLAHLLGPSQDADAHPPAAGSDGDLHVSRTTEYGTPAAATPPTEEISDLRGGGGTDGKEDLVPHAGDEISAENAKCVAEAAVNRAGAELAAALQGLGADALSGVELAERAATAAAEAAAARLRGAQLLDASVRSLMKQIALTASGDSFFWGLYGRYYRAVGEKDAAVECLMKRVRALQGSAWTDDEQAFVAYATTCTELCQTYLEYGGLRELAQGRMLLRGALRVAEQRFDEHSMFGKLRGLLSDVEAAEAKARALQ